MRPTCRSGPRRGASERCALPSTMPAGGFPRHRCHVPVVECSSTASMPMWALVVVFSGAHGVEHTSTKVCIPRCAKALQEGHSVRLASRRSDCSRSPERALSLESRPDRVVTATATQLGVAGSRTSRLRRRASSTMGVCPSRPTRRSRTHTMKLCRKISEAFDLERGRRISPPCAPCSRRHWSWFTTVSRR